MTTFSIYAPALFRCIQPRRLGALIFVSIVLTLTACDRSRVYDHFDHTPLQGWEKNDTLMYDVPSLQEAGTHTITLSLRTNDLYPFTCISLIVEQHIFPGRRSHTDTVKCDLSKDNRLKTGGVSATQMEYPLRRIVLSKGDSMHISVRHNMKREILPGISDIGIRLTRQQ